MLTIAGLSETIDLENFSCCTDLAVFDAMLLGGSSVTDGDDCRAFRRTLCASSRSGFTCDVATSERRLEDRSAVAAST